MREDPPAHRGNVRKEFLSQHQLPEVAPKSVFPENHRFAKNLLLKSHLDRFPNKAETVASFGPKINLRRSNRTSCDFVPTGQQKLPGFYKSQAAHIIRRIRENLGRSVGARDALSDGNWRRNFVNRP